MSITLCADAAARWRGFGGITDHAAVFATSHVPHPSSDRRRQAGDAALDVISLENCVEELDTPENRTFRERFRKKIRRSLGGIRRHGRRRRALHHRGGEDARRPRNHQATQNVYIVRTVKKDNVVAFDVIDTFRDFEGPVEGCKLD
jgi:hypothetical protein